MSVELKQFFDLLGAHAAGAHAGSARRAGAPALLLEHGLPARGWPGAGGAAPAGPSAAAAPAQLCGGCGRGPASRCGFCGEPGAAPCDACVGGPLLCDACGRAACRVCAGGLATCDACGYTACDLCSGEPLSGAPGGAGCWCVGRKRAEGPHCSVSEARFRAQLQHPAWRGASMAAAGLQDDGDDDDNATDDNAAGAYAPGDAGDGWGAEREAPWDAGFPASESPSSVQTEDSLAGRRRY
jgi:hypothetical protein